MVKLDVPAPEALPYPTNVSQKEQTLVGNLGLHASVLAVVIAEPNTVGS